ncbi:2-dehydro-3-deoxyphosphogalactonate aldolase [Dyella sp. OK004]|uniref:2-dehydro-3-deoxy-6-phosphogalactonate aldolase n=1 Tax=Dyella sp. OK004 TaxID=1855292 RepID=UPI0008E7A0CB|nr:2-dehydro-3-deoxy-6-phosphogalactonate aldolase [Dyella sp. OK004]SFR94897.1 2-dehydro-3-deoxyphosphogalactonate aldolase [Dyella sp. OK004]
MNQWLQPLPLVAILRGLHPDQALEIGTAIVDAGFRVLEVPLNSPRPLESIRLLADAFGDRCLVGAGTVLSTAKVHEVAEAGGRLIVMPHADTAVIAEAKRAGLYCVPGVSTPTEAFAALHAGADALKIFPAEAIPPAVVKAWRAVLPPDLALLPVGGITPDNMRPYIAAGARGFGIGSALFAPGRSAAETATRALAFATSWQELAHLGTSA